MHRCGFLLTLLVLLAAPASAQEQKWLISLNDSTDVRRVVLLQRDGDALYIFRLNREVIPISSIASLQPQVAGQSAWPIMIGAAGGGLLGYAIGKDKGLLPMALGGFVGALLGALKGGSDTPVYSLDTLDQAAKYALIDSLISLNYPRPANTVAIAAAARTGEEASGSEAPPSAEEAEDAVHQFTVGPFGTFALPVGTFGAPGGRAITGAGSGWGLGCEAAYSLTSTLSCVGSASVAFHIPKAAENDQLARGVDIGSYVLAWPMAGIRWIGYKGADHEVYLDAMAGALVQKSPEIRSKGRLDYIYIESGSTTTLAYGFGAGWTLGGLTRCTLRYRNGGYPVFETAELVDIYELHPPYFTPTMRSVYRPVLISQPTAVLEVSLAVIL